MDEVLEAETLRALWVDFIVCVRDFMEACSYISRFLKRSASVVYARSYDENISFRCTILQCKVAIYLVMTFMRHC